MLTAIAEEKRIIELYSADELTEVERFKVPSHVAIVMDGNRRWAKRQGLPPVSGHWRGAEGVSTILRAAAQLGVEALTLYAWSTENWHRSKLEVQSLLRLLKTFLLRKTPEMVREGVRLSVIGDISKFPENVQKVLANSIEATAKGDRIELILALSYGGRDEIKRAAQKIAKECVDGKLRPEEITEATLSAHLDTAKWGDPDLLIRTSGESRISNFLLWQISYAEIFLTEVLWPDFCEKHFLRAILDFQKRERRLGKDETR